MTEEELDQFGDTYEKLNELCESLFEKLEELERTYKIPKSYRERYGYDGFTVECGYFTLKGSYSHQGNWGNTDYDVSFKAFANTDFYLARYEAELMERERQRLEVEKCRKDLEEVNERRLLEKLKQKYEGS